MRRDDRPRDDDAHPETVAYRSDEGPDHQVIKYEIGTFQVVDLDAAAIGNRQSADGTSGTRFDYGR